MNSIVTERLLLREFKLNDTDFIIKLLNSEGWLRNIGERHVHDPLQAQQFIEQRLKLSYTENGFGFFAVLLKGEDVPMGICGLVKRPGLENIDIGYAFLAEYFGKGYAYEACRAVMGFAKDTLGLKVLDAISISQNAASIRLLEKLEFVFERNILLNEEELMLYRRNL